MGVELLDIITPTNKENRFLGLCEMYRNYVDDSGILLSLHNNKEIGLDVFTLRDVIERYYKDVERTKTFHPKIKTINEFKIAGFTTYWICKLKPIYLNVSNKSLQTLSKEDIWLNEKFSFYVSISRISSELKKKLSSDIGVRKDDYTFDIMSSNLDKNLIDDIYYTLRYRNFSAESLTLMYQSLFEGYYKGFVYGFRDQIKTV